MTLPEPAGFPDWGRFAARSTKVYLNDTYTATTAGFDVGTVYVGDAPYVLLFASSLLRRTEFRMIFQQGASAATFITDYRIVITTFGYVCTTIPVFGPYLRVVAQSVTSDSDTSITVSGLWNPASPNSNDADSSILHSISTAPAAGASATFTATPTWPGLASYSLWAPSGPARFILSGVRLDGTLAEFHRDSTAGGNPEAARGLVMVPPMPVQALIQNDHSAAQTIRFSLSARPMAPGW